LIRGDRGNRGTKHTPDHLLDTRPRAEAESQELHSEGITITTTTLGLAASEAIGGVEEKSLVNGGGEHGELRAWVGRERERSAILPFWTA